MSPASRRIREKLAPFTKDLDTGRIGAYINGVLTKTYNQTGEINYEPLNHLELNSSPLSILACAPIESKLGNGKEHIHIKIDQNTITEQHKRAVGFLFESVLPYGDPMKENGLRIEPDKSPLYPFDEQIKEVCNFDFVLPESKPWMLLLKCSCLDWKGKVIFASKFIGMKVVLVG